MEYDKIKQLMEDMGNSKLTHINIEFEDGTKISMEKAPLEEEKKIIEISPVKEEKVIVPSKDESNTIDDYKYITSPMVGTFYLKPSPTSEPFVKEGMTITKGQSVCIIEAMKLMNEIESEFDGKVSEVLVKDGEPVEYGTKLFKIE